MSGSVSQTENTENKTSPLKVSVFKEALSWQFICKQARHLSRRCHRAPLCLCQAVTNPVQLLTCSIVRPPGSVQGNWELRFQDKFLFVHSEGITDPDVWGHSCGNWCGRCSCVWACMCVQYTLWTVCFPSDVHVLCVKWSCKTVECLKSLHPHTVSTVLTLQGCEL